MLQARIAAHAWSARNRRPGQHKRPITRTFLEALLSRSVHRRPTEYSLLREDIDLDDYVGMLSGACRYIMRATKPARTFLPAGLAQARPEWIGRSPVSCCRLEGSDSLSVQILFVEWQHSSAKQVNAGTAIHGTFEDLQLVNLSFRLSVAPRFKHAIANGLDILPYCPSKTTNTIDARLACVM
jgi:hypothetical protein